MSVINADITNTSGSGVAVGGVFFPPFVQEKPISVYPTQFAEISGSTVLQVSNLQIEEGLADVSRVLPDGLNSPLAATDTEETNDDITTASGVATGGGASGLSGQDKSEDAQVPATKQARDYAGEQGISLNYVYEYVEAPSGAGGLLNKSDVRSYQEGTNANQPEEDHAGSSRKAEAASEGGNQGTNLQASEDEQTGPQDSNAEGSADEDGGGQ